MNIYHVYVWAVSVDTYICSCFQYLYTCILSLRYYYINIMIFKIYILYLYSRDWSVNIIEIYYLFYLEYGIN